MIFKMAVPVMKICPRCFYFQARRTYVGRPRPHIDRILRVDHAGELGADRIYAGQMAILGKTSVGPTIQHMWDQEKEHLRKFEQIIADKRVRPTVLTPLWNVAGFALGAGTALLGKEAAMACTVAVEEIISEHYDNQLRELLTEGVTDENKELLDVIQKFRDEELEHLHIGEEHDAGKAPMYETLSTVIQTGCKAAIWLSERI
ncbi:5-demethoxyubiquinone hydroxylase, mitochondrial-like [Acropora millepora]|uniref:5-demethoxyubiquinone hydroxylase, mitochondrial-like n=1 Tax=Acropora millepora TaxID=45264 RepID=UPI001CF3FAC2|nr:5-demethoxyubiquinone hydroxylase, mitochondrial-like [Acropora millepora]XP_029179871.2 5-demethoxyubiquinone hydroxylase, mitochondrial-like [Acropora millepora]XP_029179872.2 5-demethoxyubiquinone hydroxylase, mitochondrial-like [Acropora millepora]